MKNNHPKLKWWQKEIKLKWWLKRALWGLGIGFLTAIWSGLALSINPGSPFAVFWIFGVLPVLPIYILMVKVLGIGLPSFDNPATLLHLLTHFISWIIGGIAYAYIFHIIRGLTKRS